MKVKELLNESNWIQCSSAKDRNGKLVLACSEQACKWCLWGAMKKCYIDDEGTNKVYEVCKRLKEKIGRNPIQWNDDPERTWDDVRELIEELDI